MKNIYIYIYEGKWGRVESYIFGISNPEDALERHPEITQILFLGASCIKDT